jgi:hypothetical protein
MPTVTPTSNWSQSLDALRTSIANISAFQTWVNKGTAAAAKLHTHVQSKPRSGLVYPYVILEQRPGLKYSWKTGSFIVHDAQGVDLLFEMIYKTSSGTPDDFYAFTNPVGSIIEGLMDLAGVANTVGYINEPDAELLEVPHWLEEGEQTTEGGVLSCTWRLNWS